MKANPTKLRPYEHDSLRYTGLLETFCFVDSGIRNTDPGIHSLGPYLFRSTRGTHFLTMENL